jgi:hypothetical protein
MCRPWALAISGTGVSFEPVDVLRLLGASRWPMRRLTDARTETVRCDLASTVVPKGVAVRHK